jgi:ribosomal protein S18 acetylase RimI-like enzyme
MVAIRPATAASTDIESVGRLMLDAFPETFTYIFGDRDRQAAQAIGHGLHAFGSLPDAWLAEQDGACIGLVLMRWRNGATPAAGVRAFVAMARALGPLRALKVAYHIPPLPPHWLHEREAYISALAVASNEQGHGHGAALLGHAVELALSRHYDRITLRVDADNRPARSLFEQHGFVIDQRPFQWLFNMVRRHFGEVVMSRHLNEGT